MAVEVVASLLAPAVAGSMALESTALESTALESTALESTALESTASDTVYRPEVTERLEAVGTRRECLRP